MILGSSPALFAIGVALMLAYFIIYQLVPGFSYARSEQPPWFVPGFSKYIT